MQSVDYVTAKIEELKESLKNVKVQVEELRQEYYGRKAVHKIMLGALAAIGAVVGWLINNAIDVGNHIGMSHALLNHLK